MLLIVENPLYRAVDNFSFLDAGMCLLELLFLVYNGVSFIMNWYILNPDESIFPKLKNVRREYWCICDYRTSNGNPPITFAIAAQMTDEVHISVFPCFSMLGNDNQEFSARDMWMEIKEVCRWMKLIS